jgi:Mce-associated membrane protein
LGRKRKLMPKPEAATEVVAPSVDLNKSDEPDSSKPDSTQPGETVSTPTVEDTAVVAPRVSYRERRSAGRGESDGRPRRTRGSLRRGKSGPGKKRASVRGLGVVIAAVSAIALIAAMVVASTFFVLGTNKIDDRNDLRAEYSAFARQMVTNLTTLNPENIDASIKSFQDDTSGKAMEQVGQSVEQTVNMIKSENVSTRGAVISEAVTASDADSATVIMVFSWEMNQPNVTEQQTVLQVFRWKLEITRINGELKLTNVEWVT